jgi:hypothetical protein
LVGKPEGKKPLGKPRRRLEDTIKIELIETDGGVWNGFIRLRTGLVVGFCKHDNEPSGSIKFWEILVYMSSCWLLKKDSAPWN